MISSKSKASFILSAVIFVPFMALMAVFFIAMYIQDRIQKARNKKSWLDDMEQVDKSLSGYGYIDY